MSLTPSEHVLDLFAVPATVQRLAGGQGSSVRAGDLVLSPGRDEVTARWLSPLLARLAVTLDEAAMRGEAGPLRVALPVPARDGSWVVDGWAATRFEPGTTTSTDLRLTLAAGRLLHARLAVLVAQRPAGLDARADRWARAERAAFGDLRPRDADGSAMPRQLGAAAAALAARTVAALGAGADLGPAQLVHADLAGNVLLDARGDPMIIDVSPAWRPVRWAEAVAVVDSVLWFGASRDALDEWRDPARRGAVLRAVLFRLHCDDPGDPSVLRRYSEVLDLVHA